MDNRSDSRTRQTAKSYDCQRNSMPDVKGLGGDVVRWR